MPPSYVKVVLVLMLWALVPSATGPLFWILLGAAIVVTLYAISRLRYFYGTPWRRLFFPMFRAYLRDSVITGKTDSPEQRLGRLLPVFLPRLEPGEAEVLAAEWAGSFEGFLEDPFYQALIDRHGGDRPLDDKLAKFRAWFEESKNRNAYFVRYAFGNVIEEHAGTEQKRQFWEAVLANRLP